MVIGQTVKDLSTSFSLLMSLGAFARLMAMTLMGMLKTECGDFGGPRLVAIQPLGSRACPACALLVGQLVSKLHVFLHRSHPND
jgi:hypothetical protein